MSRTPIWQKKGVLPLPAAMFGRMWSWSDVGWYVAVFIGIWGALLGTGDYGLADLFFSIAAVLFLAKWGHASHIQESRRQILKFIVGTAVAVVVTGATVKWTMGKSAKAKAEADQRETEQREINDLKRLLSTKAGLNFLIDPVKVSSDGIATITFALQNYSSVPSGKGFFNVVLTAGSEFVETPGTFQNLAGAPDSLERSSYFDYLGALIHTAPIKMRIKTRNNGATVSFYYSCERCDAQSIDKTNWTTLLIPRRSP